MNAEPDDLKKIYPFDDRSISINELEDMIERAEMLNQCLSIAHSLAADEHYSKDDAVNDLLKLFKEHSF
ncbi:hypothetical protein OYT88_12265 [Sporolactobacillus sp. CQH2019]|uniref:hypothetical protein n=1 Tax=Sporolactobacillus sp. CQH2019 TaxID=3023512 RepID=UPI002368559E|nr:hypothetical protein [Sporolactobacillus sp. CQH2019]MDD9149315.1 hypothetical protein [Sporolactobacillus sp. CQH2019]